MYFYLKMIKGCVYLTTCLVTNKQYVGQTIKQGISKKYYYGSGKLLKLSIKKYSKSNFKKEIIIDNISCFTALNILEQVYIKKYNTMYPYGYNLDAGGTSGGNRSELTKQKLRDSHNPKSNTAEATKKRVETRMKNGTYVAWNKGKKGVWGPNTGSFKNGIIGNNLQYILDNINMGKSQNKIAKELGVTQSGICQSLNRNKQKIKHKKIWFINRIGKELIQNNSINLFNPPITIASKSHAIALFITQTEKGYKVPRNNLKPLKTTANMKTKLAKKEAQRNWPATANGIIFLNDRFFKRTAADGIYYIARLPLNYN